MTKLIDCKIRVPKKFQEAVASVERTENGYTVELYCGYEFENGEGKAVFATQKEVIASFAQIVELVSAEEMGLVSESADTIVENTVVSEVQDTQNEGEKPSEVSKKLSSEEITENAKNALISDYKNRIKSDFDSKSFLIFKSDVYRKYSPSIEFTLPYGKEGKLYRTFKSDGKNYFVKSKGEFHQVQDDTTISLFIDGALYNKVNAIAVLKVAFSYHKKRSFLNSLRKTNNKGMEAIQKQHEMAEQKRINALISKQFDDVLKSKIVHEFLVLGNNVDKIEKVYPNASLVLRSLNLTEKNKGNFSNASNGAILGTLKRYKRLDLVKLFELFLYGTNNNVQRFRNVDGIPC